MEEKEKVFSRRDFLKTSGVATGSLIGGSLLGYVTGINIDTGEDADQQVSQDTSQETADTSQESDYSEALSFFTRHSDFEILSTATERIFPKDDIGPGAIELGVPYFIDKQLAGTYGRNAREFRSGSFENFDGSVNQSPLNRGTDLYRRLA